MILVLDVQNSLSLDCYACGLSMVDPIEEKHLYNLDPDDVTAKMYNETCTIFDTWLLEYSSSMTKWVRPCPPDVQSCFWAKGTYNDESKSYRVKSSAKCDARYYARFFKKLTKLFVQI